MPGKNAGRQGRRWRKVRAFVLERDRGICHICRQPGATTADHYPVSRADAIAAGRLDLLEDPRNLKAAHVGCNSRRGRNGPAVPQGETRIGRTSRSW